MVTHRQVYEAVRHFTDEHGYAPTLRELCGLVGVSAVSTVRQHLIALRRDGYVTWTQCANRTIRIIGQWRDVA